MQCYEDTKYAIYVRGYPIHDNYSVDQLRNRRIGLIEKARDTNKVPTRQIRPTASTTL